MPKTKGQGVVFGIIMSILMEFGMGVYNTAINAGYVSMPGGLSNMENTVFLDVLKETAYMWIVVFVVSVLVGNPLAKKLAGRIICPEKDNPFFITLMISACTVLVMCPTMSLVATVLFNIILAHQPLTQIPAIWVGTVLKNFPMALFWNLFAAGPLTRLCFRTVFRKCLSEDSTNEK